MYIVYTCASVCSPSLIGSLKVFFFSKNKTLNWSNVIVVFFNGLTILYYNIIIYCAHALAVYSTRQWYNCYYRNCWVPNVYVQVSSSGEYRTAYMLHQKSGYYVFSKWFLIYISVPDRGDQKIKYIRPWKNNLDLFFNIFFLTRLNK